MAESSDVHALSKEELVDQVLTLRQKHSDEKKRADMLHEQLLLAKKQNVALQSQVEVEEEHITNKLLKRLEDLQHEKSKLTIKVAAEEEYMKNTLLKRLEAVTQEKVQMENQLETEQEYIVNKLQKKLDQLQSEKLKLTREKIDLENQLEAEQEYVMNKLQKQVEKLGSEKTSLQREKADLQRHVADLGSSVEKLNRDKVNLENQMEMEEENIVNRLQRQLEGLLASFHDVEAKLEAKGISLASLGVPPVSLEAYMGTLTRRASNDMRTSMSGGLRTSASGGMGGGNARRVRASSGSSPVCPSLLPV